MQWLTSNENCRVFIVEWPLFERSSSDVDNILISQLSVALYDFKLFMNEKSINVIFLKKKHSITDVYCLIILIMRKCGIFQQSTNKFSVNHLWMLFLLGVNTCERKLI